MKKLKWILPLVALCVMLGGCPYSSEFALDKPSVKINTALLGTWEPKSNSDDRYTISKFDDYTYKIVKKGKSGSDQSEYRAYTSNIGSDSFLNLWEVHSDNSVTYYFYKLEISSSGNKVTLHPLTENITEKFTSSADLNAFVKKYKDLSFFYDKNADVFIKD
jgi:hypothetical protein